MDATQILVIEDDQEDVALVKAFLAQDQSFSSFIEHRDSLSGGLDHLSQSDSVALVLLDLGLGDAQGIHTFQCLHSAFPEVPLIVLSGNSDERVALQALKAGAQDYLVKGRFDSDILSRSIRYAMERQEQRLELEYKTRALERLSEQLENANQRLEELAATDGLTKLFNRRRFDEAFLQEWGRLIREGKPLSVIMVDADHFKAYNDTYGHLAGDTCLRQISQALKNVTKRPADIVARYGGEEFVLALPGTDLDGALHVAESLRTAVKELRIPHATSSVGNQVTVSVGVASQVPCEKMAPSMLLDAADKALYFAKEKGRDRIEIYQADCPSQALTSQRVLQWVSRIRQALDRDLFSLYAQPIQSLSPAQASEQFEILLRLSDMPGISCAPALFLPIAEQYDFLGRIDAWVVDRLFQTLKTEKANDQSSDAKFYINLSSATCRNEGFSDFVQHKLAAYDLQPEQFCFEVSEAIALSHVEAASHLTQSLQAMKCQVALDDFGSGMTSFTHLKQIPVDFVKIDGLFVRDISTDSVSRAIVEAIHRVAKLMNLETIAEFVENKGILDALCSMGVDHAQGHYFDRAKPLDQVLQTSRAA